MVFENKCIYILSRLKECTTKLETLCALSPIGISNPKTKLVLLEKGLNCQRNLSFGGLNKKGQNNRTRLPYSWSSLVMSKFFLFFFFSKFMFIKSTFELFELLLQCFCFSGNPVDRQFGPWNNVSIGQLNVKSWTLLVKCELRTP